MWVSWSSVRRTCPADASYGVNCTYNGVTVSSGYINAGAGLSGTNYWSFNGLGFGFFPATPGTNQIIASIDPDQSVAETTYADNTMSGSFGASSPQVAGSFYSYSAAQIRAAYGIDSIPNFGSATADGTGQTIAIVDAYNDPTVLTDLDGFDQVDVRIDHLDQDALPAVRAGVVILDRLQPVGHGHHREHRHQRQQRRAGRRPNRRLGRRRIVGRRNGRMPSRRGPRST